MKGDLKIFTDNIQPNAVNQIYELLLKPPFKNSKVRIMPDVHCGKNCVVGFTSTFEDKVIPNVIGGDIGCGMLTVNIGKNEINLKELDEYIRKNIPSGSNVHKTQRQFESTKNLRCFSVLREINKIYCSLGTLGSGNHFIEIDRDKSGNQYLIIHTGSRNLGMQVATIYQKRAIELCKTSNCTERTKTPAPFCYLQGSEMDDYIHDLHICQNFAAHNRMEIAKSICKFLKAGYSSYFESVHNYIGSDNIIRKGAISAGKGQKVIIPMNMRDGCIIGIGKGEEEWNCSAPHGAGRLLKRGDARELFTVDDFKREMSGIYSSTIGTSTIDESPMAYKPMEEIIKCVAPTVDIVEIIKPIYNFKAGK